MIEIQFPLVSGLDRQVVVLSLGRLASAVGTGLTIFYAPIFFVNVAGISATNVGLGIGCGGFFGVLGRFLGGTCADYPGIGRKGSLLIASFLLACGAAFFAATDQFWQFLMGNILTGLGIGFYWPAAESLISDITKPGKLNEAFALTRMADYIGLGLGVVAGGLVIGFHSAYRLLFILDSASYMVLFLFVLRGISETLDAEKGKRPGLLSNWAGAARDRVLLIYAVLNLLFTNNILQMSSALPLYLSNFVGEKTGSLSGSYVSISFSVYIVLVSLLVMPIARLTAHRRKTRVLGSACIFWIAANCAVASLGHMGAEHVVFLSFLTVAAFAAANALYGPSASSLVVEIAPQRSRATYLAVNSLCWGIAGSIGPAIGLAALDHGPEVAVRYWLVLAAVNLLGLLGLIFLERTIARGAKDDADVLSSDASSV
ncbi:MAG: MFS transporter [Candidatus Obscuribacterales bacterium]